MTMGTRPALITRLRTKGPRTKGYSDLLEVTSHCSKGGTRKEEGEAQLGVDFGRFGSAKAPMGGTAEVCSKVYKCLLVQQINK